MHQSFGARRLFVVAARFLKERINGFFFLLLVYLGKKQSLNQNLVVTLNLTTTQLHESPVDHRKYRPKRQI